MLFNSIDFMFFFLIIVSILFLIPRKYRVTWLLIISYYFYMCWSKTYVILLLLSTMSTYFTGIFLEKTQSIRKKKNYIWGCVFTNVGILFLFKYFNFSIECLNWLLKNCCENSVSWKINLILPVGISYYTFQAIGYIIDVYRGRNAEKNFVKYALFVSFFPTITSGPIERSSNLLKQFDDIDKKKLWNYDRVKNGVLLIFWGLFQKIVIADRLSLYVDTVYNNYQEYGMLTLVTATILFAFQIYCDFDGYTNMACGIAEVVGIDIVRNFERPYFASNIKDFWRRWHISLTSWFRDYLYIPLGGNRKGKIRAQLNTFIVFCISGLWHGASLNYLIWGMIHGILQVVYNVYVSYFKGKKESFSTKLRNGIVTFIAVDIAWMFFRATSLEQVYGMVRQMFSEIGDFSEVLGVLGDGDRNLLILGLFIVFVVDVLHEIGLNIRLWIAKQEIWFRYLLYIGVICACLYLGVHTEVDAARNFIYFQF